MQSLRDTLLAVSRYPVSLFKVPRCLTIGENPDEQLCTEDGWEFKVESKTLSAQCPFFRELFTHKDLENSTVIHVASGDTLKEILMYLHSETIDLNKSNTVDILIASNYFMIDPLMEMCRMFVLRNLTINNCLHLFMTGWRIKSLDIEGGCYRYLQLHFEKVFRASRACVRDLPVEILKMLLKDKSLNVSEERIIWLVIEEWVNENCSDRLVHVPTLLSYIILTEIDKNLATEILHSSIVKENPFCVKLHTKRRRNELDLTNHSMVLDYVRNLNLEIAVPWCPTRLNVITRKKNGRFEIFLTYDESYDVWRKVGEFVADLSNVEGFIMGHRVCIYKYWFAFNGKKILALDLLQEKFVPMPFNLLRWGYILYVEGFFYYYDRFDRKLEVFDPETGDYYTMIHPPPTPIYILICVMLNEGIYLIGRRIEEPLGMLMEVYWPTSGTWTVVAAPNEYTAFVAAFRGHLFGFFSVTAEEYDPLTDSWRQLPDLPFNDHAFPKPVVFNEHLYVYYAGEVVCWCAEQEAWKTVSKSSPLIDLPFYIFFTLDDPEVLKDIVRENRNRSAVWVKSGLV